MNERELFAPLLTGWVALAAVAFVALLVRPAPYGRYAGTSRSRTVPSRWGWIAMESPAIVLFAVLCASGRHRTEPVALAFLALWMAHYLHRGLAYPLRLGLRGARPMPLEIVASAFLFQLVNVYFNARWLFELAPAYPDSWWRDPRFLAGVTLFAAGSVVNRKADAELLALSTGAGYSVPRGPLFRWISCPNYLGEIAIWSGWALATWSLAGLSFALWTIANLAPRARAHHRFYRDRFPDYPPQRRALLPGLW